MVEQRLEVQIKKAEGLGRQRGPELGVQRSGLICCWALPVKVKHRGQNCKLIFQRLLYRVQSSWSRVGDSKDR